jgi:hypothetical protein
MAFVRRATDPPPRLVGAHRAPALAWRAACAAAAIDCAVTRGARHTSAR